jgi:hypothetical protein
VLCIFHLVLVSLDLSCLLPRPNFVPVLSASPIFLARAGAGSFFQSARCSRSSFSDFIFNIARIFISTEHGAEASVIPVAACVVFNSAAVHDSFCHCLMFSFLPLKVSAFVSSFSAQICRSAFWFTRPSSLLSRALGRSSRRPSSALQSGLHLSPCR